MYREQCGEYKEDITWWQEDINLIFKQQEQYLVSEILFVPW